MRLDNERESGNVEDRRSHSGGYGGGISMGTVMMLWPILRPLLRSKFGILLIAGGVLAYLAGYNPLAFIGMGTMPARHVDNAKEEKSAVFIKKVLATTEDVWHHVLLKYGIEYRPPKLVLYRGYTRSGCGGAQAQMGPFYCPADKKIYLDLGFFDELAKRHDAPGDFAQAYVLAHEVGHYVQDLLGTLDKAQRAKRGLGGKRANALQVRVELQADCYAGVWGHYAYKKGLLDPGDAEEALRAASAIGDDILQRKTQGYVRPDAFTHGSSRQRVEWFERGFESGNLEACNTFR